VLETSPSLTAATAVGRTESRQGVQRKVPRGEQRQGAGLLTQLPTHFLLYLQFNGAYLPLATMADREFSPQARRAS
jgi:hypothetical protein